MVRKIGLAALVLGFVFAVTSCRDNDAGGPPVLPPPTIDDLPDPPSGQTLYWSFPDFTTTSGATVGFHDSGSPNLGANASFSSFLAPYSPLSLQSVVKIGTR